MNRLSYGGLWFVAKVVVDGLVFGADLTDFEGDLPPASLEIAEKNFNHGFHG